MAMTRKFLLPIIVAINLIALGVILASPTRYKVDFSSVLEMWGDVLRDVDRFGLTLTALPVEREIEIGDEAIKRFPLLPQHPRQQYLSTLGASVAKTAKRRRIPYRFHVVSWSEPNAFAIPGGHVLVTTGMLDLIESEAELAAILGHEIAHIDLKHCIENLQYELFAERVLGSQMSQIVGMAYQLAAFGFSELQEREADRSAIIFMADAGYSPLEAVPLYDRIAEKLGDQPELQQQTKGPEGEVLRSIGEALKDYFATHPNTVSRMRDIEAIFDRNMTAWEGETFYMGRSNYEDSITRSADDRRDEQVVFSADSSGFWFARGKVAARIGNDQDAVKMLTKAFELGGPDVALLRSRAQVHSRLKDHQNAAADFSRAVELIKAQIKGESGKARLLIESGDKLDAIDVLRAAEENHELLIATYDIWLGLPDINIEEIARWKEQAVSELLKLRLETGRLYQETGQPTQALEIFNSVLTGDVANLAAIEGAALAKFALGRYTEALDELEGLIGESNLPELYGIRARVYRAAGYHKKADREHARYVRFRDQGVPPLSAAMWTALEKFWDNKKDFKAFATTADDQDVWFRRWGYQWSRTAAGNAVRDCQENAGTTCKLYAMGNRVVWSFSDAELEEAHDDYRNDVRDKLVDQIDSFSERIADGQLYAYVLRGDVYAKMKAFDKAISDYSSYIEAVPSSVGTIGKRGVANFHSRLCRNAIKDFDFSLGEDGYPTVWRHVRMRGYCKLFMGDLDGALNDFNYYVSKGPKNNFSVIIGRVAVKLSRRETQDGMQDVDDNINKDKAWQHNGVCELLLRFAYPMAAKQFCDKANALRVMDPNILDNLAFMFWQLGDSERTKQFLADARYVDPSHPGYSRRTEEYRALLATTFLILKGYNAGMVKKAIDEEARSAIIAYQRAHGLPQTGIVDDDLLGHLTPLGFGSFRITEVPGTLTSQQIKQECAEAALDDSVLFNMGSGVQYRCNTDGVSVRRVPPPT